MKKLFLYLPEHLSKRQFLLVLSFIVGIGAALAAYLLKWLITTIEHLLTSGFSITSAQGLYLVYPAVGILLCALFIKYVVRDDIGHGVVKILYAISRKQGFIKAHNCWSSVIASAVTIGFGGSVGAESPIVLTGSAIGSILGQRFRLDHRTMMLLVGCGASAAIAGIFKAPIAGLMFTLEVLMIDLTMSSLMLLMVSCLTATCLTYALTGTEAMFYFELTNTFRVERILPSIALGIFCGFLSLYFTRMMNAFEQLFSRFHNLWIKFALGSFTLALLIFLFPPLYGEGYTTINELLHGNAEAVMNNSFFYGRPELLPTFLGLILVVKVFATTATTGGGGCGGTFAPSLFLGCIGGFVFSNLWNKHELLGIYAPETNYALLGMAGVMSGVFHAPLTGVFLIAELTGGYSLFIPLMIVSVSSYLTIHAFEPHSIYSMRLARKGELLTHNKDNSILTLMTLDAVVEKERPQLSPEMTLGQMLQVVSKENGNNFAVVNAAGTLLGVINLQSIRKVAYRSELYRFYSVEQLMIEPAIVLSTSDSMTTVMEKFNHATIYTVPVVNAERKFIGFVSKARLYAYYRQIMKDFSEE